MAERARAWRPRRIAAIALIVLALPYASVVGVAAYRQRQILFNLADDGRIEAAGGLALPGSRRVALKAADGVEIAAWYVAPRPGGKVFLFLHGQGGRLAIQTGRWRRIAEAGHGVLALSYRGYPGSKGSPSEDGIALDARAAYDWLAARHAAKDIVLHGHSLGTGVAVRLATGAQAGAMVLEAPFTAAVDVAAERMPWLPVHLLMLDQFRSRDLIGRVTTPTLIVHGESDRVIPISHAERLFQLANEPKRLVRLPHSDHNTLVRDGLYEHIAAFLRGR